MIHDREYAQLCLDTFGGAERFRVGSVNELPTVCFRGTKDLRDWIVDLAAFPLFDFHTKSHRALGPLHAGFLIAAHELYETIQPHTNQPYALCGHSLGGALACLVGALLTVDGRPPREIVTFGAPRAGMQPYVDALTDVAIRQYRFGADPVPAVPFSPPWRHARIPLIEFGMAVKSNNLWDNHNINLYISELGK